MSLINPTTWNGSWVLSDEKVNPVSISRDIFQKFGKQDVIALNFLYQSYLKQVNGVILNEEEDLNPHLQVSSFLGALYNSLKNKFLVLILCPDELIIKWHFYISQSSQFSIKIIDSNIVPDDFDQETGIVLLLSFTNIKLAEYLKEYDWFSVVIDDFDQVATKLVIRKLKGIFNIGITSRNFYVEPDQKLQWSMLNWANTACVGKLADFYEMDNDNLINFRDNYSEWWFRLTWEFCDTFVKPTLEEKGSLNGILRDWAKTHDLIVRYQFKNGKSHNNRKKRKGRSSPQVTKEADEIEDNKPIKRAKKVYKKNDNKAKSLKKIPYKAIPQTGANTNEQNFRNLNMSHDDSSDSNDTVIFESNSNTNLEDDISTNNERGSLINYQVLKEELQTEAESNRLRQSDNDQSEDDENSVSSGEQLLCSLVRNKDKKSPGKPKTAAAKCHNEMENIDESDLFLKSVAATKSNPPPLKNRQQTEKFFNKILEKSDDRSRFNSLTRMEIELTENEVLDVPSESDGFFKGIFVKESKKDSGMKEKENCSESSSNEHIDVDTLVAEVMKMVGEK